MALNRVILHPGREVPVRYGHPWIFSGAVKDANGERGLVEVFSASGIKLGTAFHNPGCFLALRMLVTGEEPFTTETLLRRIAAAVARRKPLWADHTNALRLVFAESDFLPGLVVDYYAGSLALQFNSAFAEFFRAEIVACLRETIKPKAVHDASDNEARQREKLPPVTPDEVPGEVTIQSRGIAFCVKPGFGQKTGFYLDQAENRMRIASLARGKRVLDVFCYSGGFSLACLAAGAHSVLAIDSSKEALALFEKNLQLNRQMIPHNAVYELRCADAFAELRRLREQGLEFDLVVLDPPKLAPSRGKLAAAERAYKDLNMLALQLLAPGGYLATFSCSAAVGWEKLRQILHYAAHDARKTVQLVSPLVQPEDHPVLLAFPESEYLRGYIGRVL
ncbi:MAG: class I SAM-dependent rRNA methyltransferase [Turneriella sp.]|nr:class I SAM-dependent rRNA methyltransferase [Leptospiraceae bacterium]MCX7631940.1 class I SAM-dependent rRNA methyltransferase [Turneriella sp.]